MILTPYKVGSYRRICDLCGRPRQIEDIRFSDGVAICTLHKEFRTAAQLHKINARTRPLRILPVPQPKPFAPIDTWTAEESEIFKFVVATAPFDTVDVTTSAGAIVGFKSYQAYGWAIVYLTALLIENKRPLAWLAAARTKAIALGLELLPLQNPVVVNSSISGGFNRSKLIGGASAHYAVDNAVVCAALCRLYTVTGDPRFLGAARGAAHFLANLHRVQWWSSGNVYYGALPESRISTAITTDYYPSGLLGVWALSLVQGLLGDITIGQTTPVQNGVVPARPISEIIAAIRAFWETGYGGVNGFTPETPFDHFSVVGSFFTGWVNAGFFSSDNWASAIFALTEVDGVSPRVSALWDYLRTFRGAGYDATLAPSTFLDGTTGTAGQFYDWGAAGLLAKITTVRDRAAVKRIKDVLAEPRRRYNDPHSPRGSELLYLGPLGSSTFGFDPLTAGGVRLQSVVRASKAGLIYRQLPQGFIGRGH